MPRGRPRLHEQQVRLHILLDSDLANQFRTAIPPQKRSSIVRELLRIYLKLQHLSSDNTPAVARDQK